MTVLYDNIIEWQCRRYLTKKNINHEDLMTQDVYDKCNAELQFLEYLAFKGMQCDEIMLTPAILKEAKDDLKSLAIDIPQILKMGILKSYDDTATGTQNQTEKQHYFVHLSFQEHLAARHLLKLPIDEPTEKLKNQILGAIVDTDPYIRINVCEVLGNFGESAATNEVIAALVNAMSDDIYRVRSQACQALAKLSEIGATNEATVALINATRDEDSDVRSKACGALG
ncbi:unnamed protein product, partial [Rotaria magnacalcarata]